MKPRSPSFLTSKYRPGASAWPLLGYGKRLGADYVGLRSKRAAQANPSRQCLKNRRTKRSLCQSRSRSQPRLRNLRLSGNNWAAVGNEASLEDAPTKQRVVIVKWIAWTASGLAQFGAIQGRPEDRLNSQRSLPLRSRACQRIRTSTCSRAPLVALPLTGAWFGGCQPTKIACGVTQRHDDECYLQLAHCC